MSKRKVKKLPVTRGMRVPRYGARKMWAVTRDGKVWLMGDILAAIYVTRSAAIAEAEVRSIGSKCEWGYIPLHVEAR